LVLEWLSFETKRYLKSFGGEAPSWPDGELKLRTVLATVLAKGKGGAGRKDGKEGKWKGQGIGRGRGKGGEKGMAVVDVIPSASQDMALQTIVSRPHHLI